MGQLARKATAFLNGNHDGTPHELISDRDAKTVRIVEDRTIRAVRIPSRLLDDEIWLILDHSYTPQDGLACYYAEEFEPLKNRTPEELKAIHQAKLQFPWARLIQEGPEG